MRIFARSVFDGERFLRNVLIETRDSTIIAVDQGVDRLPESDDILMTESILPGLIDAHTHLVWDASWDAAARVEREGGPRTLLRAAEHSREHLRAGVTTVRDLGSADRIALLLAEATESGLIEGPRIIGAGLALAGPGAHASGLTSGSAERAGSIHRRP